MRRSTFSSQGKKSPRAYTIAIAALEELSKSFSYKLVSLEVAQPGTFEVKKGKRTKNLIMKSHAAKRHIFSMLVIAEQLQKQKPEELFNSLEKLKVTYNTRSLGLKGMDETYAMVSNMESDRQDSVYVGIDEGNGCVKTPRNSMSVDKCEKLLAMVDQALPHVERLLFFDKGMARRSTLRLPKIIEAERTGATER